MRLCDWHNFFLIKISVVFLSLMMGRLVFIFVPVLAIHHSTYPQQLRNKQLKIAKPSSSIFERYSGFMQI